MIHLSIKDSMISHLMVQLRSLETQSDRMKFRQHLQRIGSFAAYELSRQLEYTDVEVVTPLAVTTGRVLKRSPVLLTILRAGLPFFNGFLEVFPDADCGFIGAARQETGEVPVVEASYYALPELRDRDVIIVDPMLATGNSILSVLPAVLGNGGLRSLHLVSLVSVPEGIRQLEERVQHLGFPVELWTCALDERLDERFYIVPGLGDAGDLCFGAKR